MKLSSFIVVIFVVIFKNSYAASQGDVIICEIMANPKLVDDSQGEWFEMYNNTSNSINLNGWSIADNGSNFHIISGDILVESGRVVVLARNEDTETNGGVSADYQWGSFQLANSDDEIILLDNESNEIDRVEYNTDNNWPVVDGRSMVLNLTNPNDDNNIAASWSEEPEVMYNSTDFGSPGIHEGFLPIRLELLSFTCTFEDSAVLLQWITESEIGCAGFFVYRSEELNGVYQQISDTIVAKGSATERMVYNYKDSLVDQGKKYWYQLRLLDLDGSFEIYGPVEIEIVQSSVLNLNEKFSHAEANKLYNFPNPFNPRTTIYYSVPGKSEVKVELEIFDLRGRSVKKLANKTSPPGHYVIEWDGTNTKNEQVTSGIYLCRTRVADGISILKVSKIK